MGEAAGTDSTLYILPCFPPLWVPGPPASGSSVEDRMVGSSKTHSLGVILLLLILAYVYGSLSSATPNNSSSSLSVISALILHY